MHAGAELGVNDSQTQCTLGRVVDRHDSLTPPRVPQMPVPIVQRVADFDKRLTLFGAFQANILVGDRNSVRYQIPDFDRPDRAARNVLQASQELVTLETIAQDGMRVRAFTGSGSFRTQDSLEKAREPA